MTKKKSIRVFALGLLFLSFLGIFLSRNNFFSKINFGVTKTPTVSKIYSSADWISSAITVDEVAQESDLIVLVQVLSPPKPRIVQNEIPIWDENNEISGSTIVKTIFSDTTVKVIKTYYGESKKVINVMQTGGFDSTISESVIEVIDDPLYKIDEEYILFLVDISNDSIHAPGRNLYRIVNPYGRYIIENNNTHSYGEFFGQDTFAITLSFTELELQIEESIRLMPVLTITPEIIATEAITDTPSEDITPTP